MKFWQAVLFALGAAMVSAAMTSAKQEAPARPMRQWQLGWAKGVLTSERDDDRARVTRVDVFDTEGVCLYVAQSAHATDVGFSDGRAISEGLSVAITAVPKTQLPKGVGCQ